MKNIVIGILGVGLAVSLGLAANRDVKVNVEAPNVTVPNQSFGAVAGPDIPYPYIAVSGVVEPYFKSINLVSGTTTPFAVQVTATSTLAHAACSLTTGSTTASTLVLAKGTNSNSTTTLLATTSLAANAQGYVQSNATTTWSILASQDRVFSTGNWLTFSMIGGTGTFSPAGSCVAQFVQIP